MASAPTPCTPTIFNLNIVHILLHLSYVLRVHHAVIHTYHCQDVVITGRKLPQANLLSYPYCSCIYYWVNGLYREKASISASWHVTVQAEVKNWARDAGRCGMPARPMVVTHPSHSSLPPSSGLLSSLFFLHGCCVNGWCLLICFCEHLYLFMFAFICNFFFFFFSVVTGNCQTRYWE